MTVAPVIATLVAGFSLALGAGVISFTWRDLLLGAGVAYLLGIAGTTIVAIALLTAGVPLLASFTLGVVVSGGAGLVLHRVTSLAPAHEDEPLNPAVTAALLLLGVIAVLGALGALGHPVDAWDAWSIYERKALSMFDAGGLDAHFFANPSLTFMHADYPLLLPLLEAVEIKAGAAADGTGLPVLPWLMFVAYAWTVVFVSARVARSPWALLAGIAIVVLPGGYRQALSAHADIPMAALLGAGVLLVACWLRTRSVGFLLTGVLMLAGAASAKNEGLLGAAVVLGAALIVAREPLRRRDVLAAAAFVALAVIPWRLWVAAHGIHGDVPFGDGLSPAYLADRLGRARLAAHWLARQAFGADWLLILPVAIVLSGVALVARRTRPLALFHLTAGAGVFVALVWVYWISRNDIVWYLGTSASRTVTAIVVIGTSAIAHLARP